MSRTRRWTAVGIVGVLALALGGLLWRNRSNAASTPSSTTTLLAIVTTTTSMSTTTTTVPAPTTTTEAQRVAEVEAILTDLWFGWFDAIYRKDADALWGVVATTSSYEAGVRAMDRLQFDEAPTAAGIGLTVKDILLDRPDCLVVEDSISVLFLANDPTESGVEVLWPHPQRGWRFATGWVYPRDRWLSDCDDMVREETP